MLWAGDAALDALLGALRRQGVEDVLLIAGDVAEPGWARRPLRRQHSWLRARVCACRALEGMKKDGGSAH